MSGLTLYADHGCPFAHRVLALLTHLQVPFTLRESPIGQKPQGLSRYSASGRIPLLVDGDLVLTESRVMLEYLAERFDFTTGFPDDLVARARHRHAIALVDEFLTPHLSEGAGWSKAAALRFEEVLDAFDRVLEAPDRLTLFTLQIAPVWMRLHWWRPDSPVHAAVQAWPELARKLDATLRLPAIEATSPERRRVVAEVAQAREAGLIPDDVFRASETA